MQVLNISRHETRFWNATLKFRLTINDTTDITITNWYNSINFRPLVNNTKIENFVGKRGDAEHFGVSKMVKIV